MMKTMLLALCFAFPRPALAAGPQSIEIRQTCAAESADCKPLPLFGQPGETRLVKVSEAMSLSRDEIKIAQVLPTGLGDQLWMQARREFIERLNRILDMQPKLTLVLVSGEQVAGYAEFERDPPNDVVVFQSVRGFEVARELPWIQELPSSADQASQRGKVDYIKYTWIALLVFAVGLGLFIRKLARKG